MLLFIIYFLVSVTLTGCLTLSDEKFVSDIPVTISGVVAGDDIDKATANPKLDPSLNSLFQIYQSAGIEKAKEYAKTSGLRLEESLVQVVILINPEEYESLSISITNLGGKIQGNYEDRLQAFVPIGTLKAIAELEDVLRIREPQRPFY